MDIVPCILYGHYAMHTLWTLYRADYSFFHMGYWELFQRKASSGEAVRTNLLSFTPVEALLRFQTLQRSPPGPV